MTGKKKRGRPPGRSPDAAKAVTIRLKPAEIAALGKSWRVRIGEMVAGVTTPVIDGRGLVAIGLSQQESAAMLGVSEAEISAAMSGDNIDLRRALDVLVAVWPMLTPIQREIVRHKLIALREQN